MLEIKCGVSLGSILGTLSFIIAKFIMFADDTNLFLRVQILKLCIK